MTKNPEENKRNETVNGRHDDESSPVKKLDNTQYQGNYFDGNQKSADTKNSGDSFRMKSSKMTNMKDTVNLNNTKFQDVEMKDDSCNTLTETGEFSKINKNDNLESSVKSYSKDTKVTKDVHVKTAEKEQIDQHSSHIVSKPICQNEEKATKLISNADGSDRALRRDAKARNLCKQKSQVKKNENMVSGLFINGISIWPLNFNYFYFWLTIPSLLVFFCQLISRAHSASVINFC